MNHSITNSKITIDHKASVSKKWILAPLILAAVFIIIGIIGGLIFGNPAQAQNTINIDLMPPDSSLVYMDYRNNWPNYISVSTDANMHPEVEGIKNLTLTVHNRTDKLLDNVQVKVDYLTANGKTYKSETVTLKNLEPNSANTVSAPDSDKGICVKMEIVTIQAHSFDFCYSKGMKAGNNTDPYFCK
ncbi:MAG: hypothetical protein KGM16_16670 [Bacteroidota bacterium]|nr:hypothetical protein [Bacteroidota bacterium]